MKTVLVAYEDKYCDAFHLLVKALRRDQGLGDVILERATVRGTGGFMRDVPKLLRLPMKQTKRPPDLLVCVADADRPKNLVPDAPACPTGNDLKALDAWVEALESSWKDRLVTENRLGAPDATRLRGLFIRWNKESLLTASPEALEDHGNVLQRGQALAGLLAACSPPPATVADIDFLATYRTPQRCMNDVITTVAKRKYKKGRDDEDIIRERIAPDRTRRDQVFRRCPDLARLVQLLAPT